MRREALHGGAMRAKLVFEHLPNESEARAAGPLLAKTTTTAAQYRMVLLLAILWQSQYAMVKLLITAYGQSF